MLKNQTALTAAAARAGHLIVDTEPHIFVDNLAETLLGPQAREFIDYHRQHGTHIVLANARAQVVCRASYTESVVAQAIARGVTQYVILGAGLDSFAYRSPLAARIRVFEVDYPETQAWKRSRLDAAGITVSDGITFAAVDLETGALADVLRTTGFDANRPAVVSWLGVTMYLTETAIAETLGVIGRFAPGTEIVADYMLPPDLRDEAGQTYVDLVAPMMAERGEPWLTYLSPDDATKLLARAGFGDARHLRQRDFDATLWQRADALSPSDLSVIAHARVL